MSGKIGKYTYKNESVLKEFIGSLLRALGTRKGKQVQKQLRKDPEMRKVMDRVDKANKDAEAEMTKKRKEDPEYDAHLKSMGV